MTGQALAVLHALVGGSATIPQLATTLRRSPRSVSASLSALASSRARRGLLALVRLVRIGGHDRYQLTRAGRVAARSPGGAR